MLSNELQLSCPRKKRKTIGRGGKKGTYSGKGNKGQKARTGAHVDPLFEGGRSTLIDHMKKKRGFTSRAAKRRIVQLADLEKKLAGGTTIDAQTLAAAKLIAKKDVKLGIKILGQANLTKKFIVSEEIFLSESVKNAIIAAGGEVKPATDKK